VPEDGKATRDDQDAHRRSTHSWRVWDLAFVDDVRTVLMRPEGASLLKLIRELEHGAAKDAA